MKNARPGDIWKPADTGNSGAVVFCPLKTRLFVRFETRMLAGKYVVTLKKGRPDNGPFNKI